MSNALKLLPLSVLSVLLLASAARAEPRKPTHVACVGDSITAGSGSSDAAHNYVSQLQTMLGDGVEVRNFGRSGATMLGEGYGDLPYNEQSQFTDATAFVTNAGPNAVVSVVIVLGANDSKPFNWDEPQSNAQQYKTDYLAMVDHFRNLPTKPTVYVGLPLATGDDPCCSIRGEVIYEQQIPLIKQVAMEKRAPIIDLNTDTTNHPEYFPDGVHPNDAGYLVMAQLVKKGLEREPTIGISMPAMGATPAAGMIPLTAEASGDTVDIASVEFFEGNTSLGKVTAAPFTLNWQATVGPHTITAKATDATLADKVSAPVTFTVTDAAPVGGGGAGGAAGVGGAAGAPSGGMPTAGTGGVASSGGSASGGASTGNPTITPEASSGCGCSVPGSRASGAGVALLLLGLAGLRRRAR